MSTTENSIKLQWILNGGQEVNASLKASQEEIVALKAQVSDLQARFENLNPVVRAHSNEVGEARHALMGMGEEMGVHLPRFITTFITHLGGVGPMLAQAFSTVAIIGIIEFVATQIPAAFEKAEGAITGWDAKAKKAYEDFLTENQKAVEAVTHLAMKQNEMATIGLTGTAKQTADIAAHEKNVKILSDTVGMYTHQIVEAQTELNGLNNQWVASKSRAEELEAKIERLKKAQQPYLDQINELKEAEEALNRERAAAGMGQARSIESAKIEAEKRLGLEGVKNAEELQKENLKLHAITQEQLTEALYKSEDDRNRITAEALNKKRDLIIREGKETGKNVQADIIAIDSEIESEKDNHQVKIQQIWTAGIEAQMARTKELGDFQDRTDEEIFNNQMAQRERDIALAKKETAEKEKFQDELFNYQQRLRDWELKWDREKLANIEKVTNVGLQNMTQYLTGQETFAKAVQKSWTGIADTAISNMLRALEQEIIVHALHLELGKKDILADAAQSASHVFKAVMKALPFPADVVVAPLAAAGAFAANMAFASFDKGGVAEEDMFARVHKQEMVLDPTLSKGIQGIIRSGNTGGGGASIHYSPTIYGNGTDGFRRLLRDHSDEVLSMVKQAHRDGYLRM